MLRTKIKASSITNLTDARYFAAFEVDWLGFNLDTGHERYVKPQLIQAIRGWVDGVQIVGEFNLQSSEEILTAAKMLELEVVQVGMYADLDTLIELNQQIPVIKEMVVEKTSQVNELAEMMETCAPYTFLFLLDFGKNGLDWASLKAGQFAIQLADLQKLSSQYPVLLNIGISPSDLPDLLEQVNIRGLNLQGGEEEKVGYKSFDELDELLEALVIEE